MKRSLPLLSLLLLSTAAINAQETQTETIDTGYNKWSIEVNGGVNHPTRTFTPGYFTPTFNLFHADLGARYMLNSKFGLKLDFGYDKFEEKDGSAPFESTYLRTSLQGVVNIGRVLNFETWTNTIGLLGHGGFGVSQLTSKDGFDGEDYMGNGILGLTAQVKLNKSIVLTGDLTGIVNGKQNNTFDGLGPVDTDAFDGIILNASVGFTFYLGSHKTHADWFVEKTIQDEKIEALEKRIGLIETGLVDSDKDGVADMYDLEPNSTGGVAVNSKGQAVDTNKNGVPDELENYFEKTYGKNSSNTNGDAGVEELINGGYVNVYFDFNATQPTNESVSGVAFIVNYLKANPSKNAQIIGYADEVGDSAYNKELSQKRAEAVKNIAVNAGINASRLSIVGNGEDASVNKNSKQARQIVRRVTFKVN